jgi:hypothetical protein
MTPRVGTPLAPLFCTCLSIALTAVAGCGSGDVNDGELGPGGDNDGGSSFDIGGFNGDGSSDGGGGHCVNLQCQVHTCTGGGTTSISGVVYDPAMKNPLYDVVVYIPNAPVQPLKNGASCDTCDSLFSGSPIVATLTDSAGKFTLNKVPDGSNIPLVVQIGKWRKQFTVPTVTQCKDNPVPDKTLSLPNNHTVGDIPQIAIATGGADTLECLLSRIGVDKAEYMSGPGGDGHLHIYGGTGKGGATTGVPNTSPAAPMASDALWNSATNIMQYDIVLLSCEGHETDAMNQKVLFDYAAAGGRVFASHFHYAWFNTGPFAAGNLARWTTGSNDMGDITATIQQKLWSGAPFPKGVALDQWLGNVKALDGAGELPIQQARHNADLTAANTASQPWIVADGASPSPGAVEYFTFNTPLGVAPDKQCGRVVYSDLHVGAASNDYGGTTGARVTPSGCTNADLSPQEKALEFMLFDLSSCVVPDDTPPVPPGGIK